MANIGPLTTTFKGPSDCSLLSVQLVGGTTSYYNYVGSVWPSPLRCFPSGYPYANSARFSNFYSPGICPSSWLPFGITSNFPDPAETTAICCPPGFTAYETDSIYDTYAPCFTTNILTSPVTALVISGSIDILNKPYGDNTAGVITSTALVPEQRGWSVFGVQIRYRSKDFDGSPHQTSDAQASSTVLRTSNIQDSTSSTTSPHVSTDTTTSSTISTNINNSTLVADNNALSNGAKIGMGVGIPLFILAAAVIFAFIFIRRKKRPKLNQVPEAHRDNPNAPYKDDGDKKSFTLAELEASTRHAELPATVARRPTPNNSTFAVASELDNNKVLFSPEQFKTLVSPKSFPTDNRLLA